jgi:beta-N-acetylhexosaminidase
MKLNETVGRLFMIGLPGKTVDLQTKRLLERMQPGFIILFGRNIDNPQQAHELVNEVNEILPYKPVFAIDQEGGLVSRFRKGFAVSPGAMALAATGDPDNARKAAEILAKEMRAVGIHWNLAPVVDINNNPENPGIGVRSFGDNHKIVAEFATAFVQGLRRHGILPCLKHFPGKGRVNVDAHLDLPVLDLNLEELLSFELIPFKHITSESIMVSHVYLPKLQKEYEPCSLAKEILTDVAKHKLSYKGLLISDDLLMKGVTNYFPVEEAAAKAFASGMDVLLISDQPDVQIAAKDAVLDSIKRSPTLKQRLHESLEKIEQIRKHALSQPHYSIDIIGDIEHLKEMERIADLSITAKLNNPEILPLDFNLISRIYTVKLTRMVQVEDAEEPQVPWAAKVIREKSQAALISFDAHISSEEASKLVSTVPEKGLVIMFTENAHLYNGQKWLVKEVAKRANKFLLVALRNPYDCFIDGVQNCIATYGYELVSQKSLLKVLAGVIEPTGRFPVRQIEIS